MRGDTFLNRPRRCCRTLPRIVLLAGAGLAAARRALHAAVSADAGSGAPVPAAGNAEHRLHAGLVAGIVVIAAVVSVAAVSGGAATKPAPPGQGGSPRLTPHSASAAGSIHDTVGPSGEQRWGSVALASNTTSLAAGAATTITLVDGISITVAPGWTVTRQGQQSANLLNSDQTAGLTVDAGRADAPDIRQESTAFINQNIQINGLTNVQQTPAPPTTLQGKNFQEVLKVDYTADAQNNQGTMQIYGGWVTLYSASTHMAGLFNLYANSQAVFKASLRDAGAMLGSME
jgi:hypothetical protein